MVASDKKLKKIDDNTFQETKDDKHLEWRRRFNTIRFAISNIRLSTRILINEVGVIGDLSDEKEILLFKDIKPSTNVYREITGEHPNFHSKFYEVYKDEDEEDQSIYDIDNRYEDAICGQLENNINISLLECEEPHQAENYPNGYYYGRIEGDSLLCRVPSSQMDKLIDCINSTALTSIELEVNILSFYREDESYKPKNFLIEEDAVALLSAINVSTIPEPSVVKNDGDAGIKKSLNRILKTLWVIVIILIIQLLFKTK